jgi:hypothetical protein
MKGSETTLGDIFTLSAQDVSDRVSSAIKSDQSEAKGLPNQILKKMAGEVGTRFGELLDVSLVDIMGSAWQKYASLWKYGDPQKYPPSESVLVPLGEHTIDSTHEPAIEVLVGDKPVVRLKFNIDVALKPKSAIVRIQGGRIKEIQPGEVHAEGKIKFGEVVLAEHTTRTVAFPRSINLGDGIAIRP